MAVPAIASAPKGNGTYFGLSIIVDARKPLMAKSEVAGPGSIGWLVTKHPHHLSEGQPAWIVKREAICINAAAVSRGARDRPKRWSSSLVTPRMTMGVPTSSEMMEPTVVQVIKVFHPV